MTIEQLKVKLELMEKELKEYEEATDGWGYKLEEMQLAIRFLEIRIKYEDSPFGYYIY